MSNVPHPFEFLLFAQGRAAEEDQPMKVWEVSIPEYDNYETWLFQTRESAVAWIKKQREGDIGEWREEFDGEQFRFMSRLLGGSLIESFWALEEVEVRP